MTSISLNYSGFKAQLRRICPFRESLLLKVDMSCNLM